MKNVLNDGQNLVSSKLFIREITQELVKRLALSSVLLSWFILAQYALLVWTTPIDLRYPTLTIVLGAYFLVSATVHSFIGKIAKNPWLQMVPLFASLTVWSGFVSWGFYAYEISWTTFVLILTSVISTTLITTQFSPKIKLSAIIAVLGLAPPTISNIIFVSGPHGIAIGGILFIYGFVLYKICRGENQSFWKTAIEKERLRAVIDSIPGTICWIDEELNYRGTNKRFSSVVPVPKDEGQVKTVGSSIYDKGLKQLAETLFESSDEKATKIIEHGDKTFFHTAQKFNSGSEAVITGTDFTESQYWHKELQMERARLIKISQSVVLGQILDHLRAQGQPEVIVKFFNRHRNNAEVNVVDLIRDIMEAFQNYSVKKPVHFEFNCEIQSGFIKANRLDLFLAISTLVINALESLMEDGGTIKLGINEDSSYYNITIEDNGEPLDELLEDVLFEPLFTTKGEEKAGLGLPFAKSYAQTLGGDCTIIDGSKSKFQFQISKHQQSKVS